MAAVLSILGGTAGFLAALIALALFSAPLFSAFLIWVGTGCAVVLFGLTRAMLPQATAADHPAQELA